MRPTPANPQASGAASPPRCATKSAKRRLSRRARSTSRTPTASPRGSSRPSMWAGIVLALVLCLATAVCYAEMAKLYPGTGSSYYFAEQSFLNHDKAWRYARISKFIVGWGSHLYYWIYPGVMVGVMGVLCGYLVGTLWPNFMNASNPGVAFMMLVAILFSFVVAYIANRGVNGSTAVSIAINVIQIAALVLFSVVALGRSEEHTSELQ